MNAIILWLMEAIAICVLGATFALLLVLIVTLLGFAVRELVKSGRR